MAIIIFQRQLEEHVLVMRLFLVFNFPIGVAEKSTAIEIVTIDWLPVKIYNNAIKARVRQRAIECDSQ